MSGINYFLLHIIYFKVFKKKNYHYFITNFVKTRINNNYCNKYCNKYKK
jgi:hypothetical protein